jgi:hypothetical protein
MKRVLITVFVLVAALSVASITLAQSEPAQTPTENACYAGGAWDGKCDWPTEAEDNWAWTCGWYYARVIDGRIGAAQAPATCKFVAEQEPVDPVDPIDPVDPVDPEVCDPEDDVYEFEVTQTRFSGYAYNIAAPGVLANDGACGEVDTFVRGDSNNLALITMSIYGSIDVTFTDAPAYVEFRYITTDGQSANGRIDLLAPPTVDGCVSNIMREVCVEGDTLTYTVLTGGDLIFVVGAVDTYATVTLCFNEVNSIVSAGNFSLYYGLLSDFGGIFANDNRTYCVYRLDIQP